MNHRKVSYKELIIKGFLISASSLAGVSSFIAFDYLSAWYIRLDKANSSKEKATKVEYTQEPEKPLLREKRFWYEPKPNLDRHIYYGGYKYKLTTDQHGFRVNPKPQTKNKPIRTLFLIGDSFTFGTGLDWDDTYSGILEKKGSWRVINAGVESHSPSGYAFRLKKSIKNGLVPKDSTIIMTVDISDVQDESKIWSDKVINSEQSHHQNPSSPGSSQPNNLQQSINNKAPQPKETTTETSSLKTNLANFAATNFPKTLGIIRGIRMQEGSLKEPIAELDRSAFTFKDWDELDPSYAPLGVEGGLFKVRKYIHRAATTAYRNGHKFFILSYPWPAQLYKTSIFNWVDFLTSSCVAPYCTGVIDASPEFDPNSPKYKYYLPGDMHFNRHGNEILANKVIKELSKAGL